MRTLSDVQPTPEQLSIISRNRPGVEVIRGAAGSGKTTTALLRLRSLIGVYVSRRQRLRDDRPVRVLILTYNRTLRGYIEELANRQVAQSDQVDLTISTFARWARELLDNPEIIQASDRRQHFLRLAQHIDLPSDFLCEEVEYVMGRFSPENLGNYLEIRRDGRGVSPRVERPTRVRILEDVIHPYQRSIDNSGIWDWNDLAVSLSQQQQTAPYDIIITDETQDFSANQIRAITNHLSDVHSLTFVVDTIQRIYARGFTWQEVGITIRPENSRRLHINYRNTSQISRFAFPLVDGVPIDDDSTLPDFSRTTRNGPLPTVLKGRFSGQVLYVAQHIQQNIDLERESVGILHPLGGGWLNFARTSFQRAGLGFVDIAREPEWPNGPENIAFSTLHSAKGLEFDHVFIIGLNREVLQHGPGESDDRLMALRRLLAMGITRARESVIIGYKPDDASDLIDYLDASTYNEVEV